MTGKSTVSELVCQRDVCEATGTGKSYSTDTMTIYDRLSLYPLYSVRVHKKGQTLAPFNLG